MFSPFQKANWLINRCYIINVPKYKLVTFQNAGTHWMRGILANYFHANKIKENVSISKLIPIYRDAAYSDRKHQLEDGICIETTHEKPNLFYYNSTVILLKRDLLHALSSHYQHAKRFNHDINIDKEEFLFGDKFFKKYGFANVDSRLDWITAWNTESYSINKHIVWYEELKRQPALILENMTSFMGRQFDPLLAKYAINQSSRDKLVIETKLFNSKIKKEDSLHYSEIFSHSEIERILARVSERKIPKKLVFFEA